MRNTQNDLRQLSKLFFFSFSGYLETSKIFQLCSKVVGNSKVTRTNILVALAPKIAKTYRVACPWLFWSFCHRGALWHFERIWSKKVPYLISLFLVINLRYLKSKHGWSDVRLKTKGCSTFGSCDIPTSWLSLHCILISSLNLLSIVCILLVVAVIQMQTIHLKKIQNFQMFQTVWQIALKNTKFIL